MVKGHELSQEARGGVPKLPDRRPRWFDRDWTDSNPLSMRPLALLLQSLRPLRSGRAYAV